MSKQRRILPFSHVSPIENKRGIHGIVKFAGVQACLAEILPDNG
jgi:hypothetical protein